MDYNELRHLADSWGLAGLVLFFVCAILWAFRPGSAKGYQHLAALPLTDDRLGERDDRQ